MPPAAPGRPIRWRLQAMVTLVIAVAPVLSLPRKLEPAAPLASRPPVQNVELLRTVVAPPPPLEDLDDLPAAPARAELPATRPTPKPATPPATTRTATPFLRGLYTGSARTSIDSRGKSHVVWMEVTAYCPCPICCGPGAHGVTASGEPVTARDGFFVAADADRFPFGAKLRIPGYHDGQTVEVLDRGSAILGPRLDVFFPTHAQAEAWGRQWLPVTVEGE